MDLIVSQTPFSANVLQFYTKDDDDDGNNKDKFDNLPKVTRLINGKAKIWTQATWPYSLYHILLNLWK